MLQGPIRRESESLLSIHPLKLRAAPSRVVIRPFDVGRQPNQQRNERAERLVTDVLSLDDAQADAEYEAILADFSERHWQTERVFDQRFADVAAQLDLPADLTRARQRLIGAYFCNEYSYAAAALMNPSAVEHPDQSGLSGGAVRMIMSMRAVGEGHISSIAFREGIVEPDGSFELWPQQNVATAARAAGEREDGAVCISRNVESTLSSTVIFPLTDQQSHGLEDLRLVRFDHGAGDHEWIGTYTAFDGRTIRGELLRTRDFRTFTLSGVRGRAGRNKGMALFPQMVGGRYRMLGRQDGKNLYLLSSDRIDSWDDDGVMILEPKFPWEFIQLGNCGSPLLTDAGWLVLTHGVGAMRKYSIGAVLLDRDDPEKVLARSSRPLLSAKDSDREGYVPNVVYSCGAINVGGTLFMPYGISDSAIGFASAPIAELIASLD